MPAGLDGNADPIVSAKRTAVIDRVAVEVAQSRRDRAVASHAPFLVAIDGIDGSGKSTFADELAGALRRHDLRVERATIDSFHNPKNVRRQRGATSPVGFYLDSHNLVALEEQLLRPLRAAGTYVTAVFDEPSDRTVDQDPRSATDVDVLVFDAIFALRPELASYWDFTVFLDGQRRVNLRRLGYVLEDLPTEPIDVVAHVLDWDRKIDRYASGMRYYLDLVSPMTTADLVVNNNDLSNPEIVDRS